MTFADAMLRAAIYSDLPAAEIVATYYCAQLVEAMPRLLQAELVIEACVQLIEREPWLAPTFGGIFEAAA